MCNGCGACRTQSEGTRMCPTFRPAPREEASPRSKANLARGLLTGSLPAGTVVDDKFKEILRSLRPLPHVPLGVPGERRHSQAHGRSQGGIRRHERARLLRMGRHAHRLPVLAGGAGAARRQLGGGQSGRAVAHGEDARHRPGTQTAAVQQAAVSRVRHAAPPGASRSVPPARRCCCSSTPTPTTATTNSPRHWWRCWSTTAFRCTCRSGSSSRGCR